jgi:hypothetical protein
LAKKNEKGEVVEVEYNPEKVKEGWRAFMEDLAQRKVDQTAEHLENNSAYEEKITGIMKEVSFEEVLNVVRGLKNGKACGPDGINAEILKMGGEDLIQWMVKVFTRRASQCCVSASLEKRPRKTRKRWRGLREGKC